MIKYISLFSGCGGGDIGFHGDFSFLSNYYCKLPFELVYANEIDLKVARIFDENFDLKCDKRDIRNVQEGEIPDHDLLIGGFPCQSFSIVAQNPKRLGYKDEKGMLFFELCRILWAKKPLAFIAENVRGIMSANKGEAFPLILKEFEECGYDIKHMVLNAADYGVPQKRQRVFIIGTRRGYLQNSMARPLPTHGPDDGQGQLLTDPHLPLGSVVNIRQRVDDKYYFSEKAVAGMKRAKKEMNKGRAQDLNKPCNTVGAHLAKVSLNGTDPVLKVGEKYRRFTPREVAGIQSFPESFRLVDSERAQYIALGNAIPPVLAWHVAKTFAETVMRYDLSDAKHCSAPS